jgi:retron-type reverse transcriptase
LNEVFRAIVVGKVSYVLEVDIQGYFQNIVHEHLMAFLQQRIKDSSLLRLNGGRGGLQRAGSQIDTANQVWLPAAIS